jgi:diketogulonate reductase-like aldo/keto reductase
MENSLPKTVKLNNGIDMPVLGFGTVGINTVEPFVTAIMEAGYRHIDTAMLYGNEELIGQALEQVFAKGIKREEIFLTTKLWHTEYGDVEGSLRKSLARLKLDYVDQFLIHWPNGYMAEPKKPIHKIWPEMEALVEKGLVKSIGISNFNVQMVWDLLCYCKITPAVNQVELNPQNPQLELIRFLKAKNIQPVAFTPVARPGAVEKGDLLTPSDWPDLRDSPVLKALAEKYERTVVQIMLNWGVSRGHVVIPKAASLKYQLENAQSLDFKLSDEDVEAINGLDGRIRLCNKFDDVLGIPHFEGWDLFA